MPLTELLSRIEAHTHRKAAKSGAGHVCRCPAHEDGKASLCVSQGTSGKLVLHCQAGCKPEDVLARLGLTFKDLFNDADGKASARAASGKPRIVATYDYRDEAGKMLFQVCRFDPKDFRQRRPDQTAFGDGWTWNTRGVRRVLYRLPELLAAVKAGQSVFIAEGEKDVEALAKQGLAATCNCGGAGKWRVEYNVPLRGAAVLIIADKDAPGRAHAVAVAAAVKPLARCVKVLELPDVNDKPVKDAADYFAAGGTADDLRKLADAAPEFAAQVAAAANAVAAINPNVWFKNCFPMLAEAHGEPVALKIPQGGRPSVQDLNESFLAATLGQAACPAAPVVFIRPESRFYAYRPEQGIFGVAADEDLSARLSGLLLTCARDCRETCDVSALEFALRDTAALAGTVRRARATLAAPDDFFAVGMEDFLPVGNGILRVADRTLLPFSPNYCRRNKLAVDYNCGARCPVFQDTLLRTSLEDEDIGLLQRWAGLALIGRNIAQRILILSGTAGAGKGTFIRILKGVVGEANIGSLRTDKLGERFEIGRLLNKTLLYGADVPFNFLNIGSASILKSLTGGDPMTVEFKGSMDSPSLTCAFNVIVTSNSRLTVHLEGDVEAWQRRLAIVTYEKPKPANIIPDLSERIMASEGPGVLNWMLDGLYALRSANWQLALSPRQKARVDELLLESDSVNVFFRERCVADSMVAGITVSETYGAYADFCMDRGWNPSDRYQFGREAPDIVQRSFRLVPRHDIKGPDGKSQRGWKTLRLLGREETAPE
jgi:P4 family phage/plasmid primase-like protien